MCVIRIFKEFILTPMDYWRIPESPSLKNKDMRFRHFSVSLAVAAESRND